MPKEKKVMCGPIYQTYQIDREKVAVGDDAIPLTFSSELPGWMPRYSIFDDRGVFLILDHSKESVDLDRARSVGLAIRDTHFGDQVGITDGVELGSDRKCHGNARFGKSSRSKEIHQDVIDDIRRAVSVRFEATRLRFESKNEQGVETWRAIRWAPIHVAIVPDGEDYTVGMDRDKKDVHETVLEGGEVKDDGKDAEGKPVITVVADRANNNDIGGKTNMEKCKKCGADLVDGVCPKCTLEMGKTQFAAERAKDKKRSDEIWAVGEKYGQKELAMEFIRGDKSVEEFKDVILKSLHDGKISFEKPVLGDRDSDGNPILGKDKSGQPIVGFKSFGEQLKAVAVAEKKGGFQDPRLIFDRTDGPTGMSTAVPSDGGYLVQSTFTQELMLSTKKEAVLYPKCRRIPIGQGANGISAPIILESSRATGSRLGGMKMYWVGQGKTVTDDAKIKWGLLEMKLQKLMGTTYVTEEMLQDYVQLEAIVKGAYGEESGFMVDDAIIRGSGTDQPLGFLSAPALVTVTKETNQKADTIVAENVMKMYARMPARSKARAEWYVNDECYPQLFSLNIAVGTGGIPVFLPPSGLASAPFGMLFGRPVTPIEQASALGDAGDIIFADLNEYLIIDKDTLTSDVSIHVRFLWDEMTYKFTLRVNGQPVWKTALSPYKGSDNKSPFVVVGAR